MRKDFFFFLLFLILFLATFREFFFTGRVFFERDTTVVEIPARKLTAALLREGNFALWTDAYGNGQPFLANPKNAVFYPATLLYLILPLFTAFKLYYFVHVLVGWLGLYYLGKSYGLSEKAAFFGASLFGMSGMYLSSFEFYNHLAALAWMPWILLVLNREPRTSRARLILPAVLWALLILAGSPETIVLAALLAAAQAFLRPGEWRKRLLATGLSLGLACLLAAAQLIPSFEMLAQTGREAQSIDWPLDLLQLPNMSFPHVLGNDREPGHHDFWGWHLFDRHFPLYYSIYMGFGALLLVLLGLRRPWDRRRKALIGATAVFFLLACGRYSPFFFLYRITPFLSSIRYPVKFFLGSVFCLSLLAGFGLDEATAGRLPGRKSTRTLALVSGICLGLFLIFKGRILSVINALLIIEKDSSLRELGLSVMTGLVLLAVYAVVFVLLSRAWAWRPAFGWVLIALALVDPAYHNRWINPTAPASFYSTPPIMADLKSPLAVYRAEDYFLDRRERSGSNVRFLSYYHNTLYPLSAMGDGVQYIFNLDFYGTYPKRYRELVQKVKELPAESQLQVLRWLGCNYFISDNPMFSKETARKVVVETFPVFIEAITDRAAAPYVVFSTRRISGAEDGLGLFLSPGFDPYREVLAERDLGLAQGPGFPNAGVAEPSRFTSMEVSQGRGRYRVTLFRAGVAVFPGNYARGWRAWIDGRRSEVFEANLLAKGLVVPAGEHEVVLRYLPGSFIWGSAVSLATIIFLTGATLVARSRARRRGRPASA